MAERGGGEGFTAEIYSYSKDSTKTGGDGWLEPRLSFF